MEFFSQSKNAHLNQDVIIRLGEVVNCYDEYDGLRVKIRTDQDNNLNDEELPYAFPLLPKTIQCVPKKGEAVFVIFSKLGNKNSIRYYLGPLISQPQFFYDEQYYGGSGTSSSLIQGNSLNPLKAISYSDMTKGAFPNINDVALVGRKSEDIILKDGEIDIRCGIRGEIINLDDSEKFLKGYVGFNNDSPAYLQLKYKRGIAKNTNSVINIVADKINLISHNDVNSLMLTDNKELIPNEQLDNIMQKLHQLPYGDILVEYLKILQNAILTHVHSYPGLPPCDEGEVKRMKDINFDEILSPNVRIS